MVCRSIYLSLSLFHTKILDLAMGMNGFGEQKLSPEADGDITQEQLKAKEMLHWMRSNTISSDLYQNKTQMLTLFELSTSGEISRIVNTGSFTGPEGNDDLLRSACSLIYTRTAEAKRAVLAVQCWARKQRSIEILHCKKVAFKEMQRLFATKLQCSIRQHQARRVLVRQQWEKEQEDCRRAAIQLQTVGRTRNAKRELLRRRRAEKERLASVRLQCKVRQKAATIKLANRREERRQWQGARLIQGKHRQRAAVKVVGKRREARRREQASVKLQRSARIKQAREKLLQKRNEHKASIMIQSHGRRRVAQRHAKTKREEVVARKRHHEQKRRRQLETQRLMAIRIQCRNRQLQSARTANRMKRKKESERLKARAATKLQAQARKKQAVRTTKALRRSKAATKLQTQARKKQAVRAVEALRLAKRKRRRWW